jgi:NADH:ubiquinone oxidoreductase subunit C
MFKGIKNLIDSRLKQNIILDELNNNYGTFIKIDPSDLYLVLFFLKRDPDTKLSILEQIIDIEPGFFSWPNLGITKNLELLYQFKSLKMPYKISVSVEIDNNNPFILCIKQIYKAASFFQEDLSKKYNLEFEEPYNFKLGRI